MRASLRNSLSLATSCGKMTFCHVRDRTREAYERSWHQTTVDRDHWSEIRKSPDGAKGCVEFGLLCWNLLSQDLIDANRPLYAMCKPSALLWNQRLSLIRNHLSDPRFQIICLQVTTNLLFVFTVHPAYCQRSRSFAVSSFSLSLLFRCRRSITTISTGTCSRL